MGICPGTSFVAPDPLNAPFTIPSLLRDLQYSTNSLF